MITKSRFLLDAFSCSATFLTGLIFLANPAYSMVYDQKSTDVTYDSLSSAALSKLHLILNQTNFRYQGASISLGNVSSISPNTLLPSSITVKVVSSSDTNGINVRLTPMEHYPGDYIGYLNFGQESDQNAPIPTISIKPCGSVVAIYKNLVTMASTLLNCNPQENANIEQVRYMASTPMFEVQAIVNDLPDGNDRDQLQKHVLEVENYIQSGSALAAYNELNDLKSAVSSDCKHNCIHLNGEQSDRVLQMTNMAINASLKQNNPLLNSGDVSIAPPPPGTSERDKILAELQNFEEMISSLTGQIISPSELKSLIVGLQSLLAFAISLLIVVIVLVIRMMKSISRVGYSGRSESQR